MKIHIPIQGAKMKFYPKGSITQLFGNKLPQADGTSYYAQFGVNGHPGLDIVAPFRTPILATKGKVVEANDNPEGLGRHIKILTEPDTNGDYFELSYGHADELLVKVKDKVENGQEICLMGNSGSVVSSAFITNWGLAPARGGVHLHLGVRACSTKKTKWISQYSDGTKAYIKDYENGFRGNIDPLPFIEIPPQVKFQFEKNLILGMEDDDVLVLQRFLNSHQCPVASVGAGSPGKETRFFGQLTKQAVIKFQAANSFPQTGEWTELSRAKANSFPEW